MTTAQRRPLGLLASRTAWLAAWLAALLVAVWIYWPGISSPAMLDDRSNVGKLHYLQDDPTIAADYVFGNRSGPLGRPVSVYSFVLEELYLGGDTAVRKQVNILLHAVNGALVIWLFALLLGHARVPHHRWFALLAGAAWLFSPLYVSTVLYVVQRMAMLSTLFMLLALIVYVYWRRVLFRGAAGAAGFVLLLACIALAVLSKENGILVIPLIVLLEVLWFEGRDRAGAVDPRLRRYSLGLLAAGAVAAAVAFALAADGIIAGYASRDFTLTERLLTQARILWDYLGQLLWPDLPRMGVFHDDYRLSTSLTQPPATLYAVGAWLVLVPVGLALLRYRAGRLLVCAALVFLVGHALESTVFSLELYFEHRNYFPGMGVFLLLAVGLGCLGARWPQLTAPLLAWSAAGVLLLAVQTGSQVQLWSSPPLLRLNYVTHHPDSFRANEEIALHLAGVGALDAALAYSKKAAELSNQERHGDRQIREIAAHCLADRPVPEERFAELGTVNPQRPFAMVTVMYGFARIMERGLCTPADRLAFADRMAGIFLGAEAEATASLNYYTVLAGMENDLARYDNAYRYMEKVLAQSPDQVRALLMQLHFATALGREAEAASLAEKLIALREAGELNVGQTQTLALYL